MLCLCWLGLYYAWLLASLAIQLMIPFALMSCTCYIKREGGAREDRPRMPDCLLPKWMPNGVGVGFEGREYCIVMKSCIRVEWRTSFLGGLGRGVLWWRKKTVDRSDLILHGGNGGDCAPLVNALVPFKCTIRNLQFPHRVVAFTKEKMPWCTCPYKNEAYRFEREFHRFFTLDVHVARLKNVIQNLI